MTSQLFGIFSGVAIVLSFVPYIRDVLAHKTKPERASWLIWSILGAISFFSQRARGATDSAILPAMQAMGDVTIFLLALKYGLGGILKRDMVGLLGAAVGLVAWSLTKEPAVALFCAIIIDAIGTVLTVIKTHDKPSTETISSWYLTLAGGFFATFAVGKFDLILLAFPIYICLASISVLISIKLGLIRSKKNN